MRLKYGSLLAKSFILLSLAACSGGGGGGEPGPEGLGGDDGTVIDVDFTKPISADTCVWDFDNVFGKDNYYEEELYRAITRRSAACVKKVILTGDLDVNQPIADTFGSNRELPVWIALQKDSMFFSDDKGAEYKTLKVLVEAGANLNLVNQAGDNPLLHTLKKLDQEKYPTVAQYIIQSGKLALDQVDRQNKAAIHYLVEMKILDTLNLVIDQRANINLKDGSGRSPLIGAIQGGWQQGAQLITDRGARLDQPGNRGQLPVQEALNADMGTLAESMIPQLDKDSLNHKNSNSESVVATAIRNKNLPVTQMLFAQEIDYNSVDDSGFTPLFRAVQWGNIDVLKEVIAKTEVSLVSKKNIHQDTPLHMAVSNQFVAGVEVLLSNGADFNVQNGNGDTPLLIAARNGFLDGVNKLVQKGANLDLANKQGDTAMHVAKSIDVANVIANAGASLEVKNNNGYTPIVYAIKQKNEAYFMWLLNKEVDVSWKGDGGQTLLHLAVVEGYQGAIEKLTSTINVNEPDSKGVTPLFRARSLNMVNRLLTKGANIEAADNNGRTPFIHFVQVYVESESPQYLGIIEKLILEGADVNHVSQSIGFNVIFYVIQHNDGRSSYSYPDLLALLAESDLNVNSLDEYEQTVLFHADTVEEIQFLRRGTKAGVVDETVESKDNYLTALENFQMRLDRANRDVVRNQAKVDELNEQIEAAKEEGDDSLVKTLETDLSIWRSRLRQAEFERDHFKPLFDELIKG